MAETNEKEKTNSVEDTEEEIIGCDIKMHADHDGGHFGDPTPNSFSKNLTGEPELNQDDFAEYGGENLEAKNIN